MSVDQSQRAVPIALDYDGSPVAPRAVRWAADRATGAGASVRLVAAWEPQSDRGPLHRYRRRHGTRVRAQQPELLVAGRHARFGPVTSFLGGTSKAAALRAVCPVALFGPRTPHPSSGRALRLTVAATAAGETQANSQLRTLEWSSS